MTCLPGSRTPAPQRVSPGGRLANAQAGSQSGLFLAAVPPHLLHTNREGQLWSLFARCCAVLDCAVRRHIVTVIKLRPPKLTLGSKEEAETSFMRFFGLCSQSQPSRWREQGVRWRKQDPEGLGCREVAPPGSEALS